MNGAEPCLLKDLGDEGRRYVEEWLCESLTLGRLVRESRRLAGIGVSAVLPAGVDVPRGHQLTHGGLMRAGPARDCLFTLLSEAFSRHELRFITVDILAHRGDPLPWRRTRHLTYEDEIYYLTSEAPSRDEIENAVADAQAASGFVGFGFEPAAVDLSANDGGELTLRALRMIADAVRLAVVDVFDGETSAIAAPQGILAVPG